MKKSLFSLAMLAAAAGLALGVAQGAKAATPWFFASPTSQGLRADRSGGWYVKFIAGLSANTSIGGTVSPFESNQMFGVATPFASGIVVGCQLPRSSAASTAQRSWTYNFSQSYPTLGKSCLGFGNAVAVQGNMTIQL